MADIPELITMCCGWGFQIGFVAYLLGVGLHYIKRFLTEM